MARNLGDKLLEHKRDVEKRVLSTALARRSYEQDIKIRWQDAKVVRQIHDLKELFIAEQLQIFTGSKEGSVINERQSISKAWKFVLKEKMQHRMNEDE